MSIGLSDDAYVPDTPNYALFFLLKCGTTDQWVRFWSGFGDYAIEADDTDTEGGVYQGLGALTGVPEIEAGVNGSYQALEFSLSGVSAETLALAGADRAIVKGAPVHLGVVDLDGHQQPTASIDWLFKLKAGAPRSRRSGQGGQATRTIALPAVMAFSTRELTASQYLTPPGQRARSSDDAFCDLTPAYSSNSTVKWPA